MGQYKKIETNNKKDCENMIIYIFIIVVLVLVAERRNNVQYDGKNDPIYFLLFLTDYLFHLFIGSDTACSVSKNVFLSNFNLSH